MYSILLSAVIFTLSLGIVGGFGTQSSPIVVLDSNLVISVNVGTATACAGLIYAIYLVYSATNLAWAITFALAPFALRRLPSIRLNGRGPDLPYPSSSHLGDSPEIESRLGEAEKPTAGSLRNSSRSSSTSGSSPSEPSLSPHRSQSPPVMELWHDPTLSQCLCRGDANGNCICEDREGDDYGKNDVYGDDVAWQNYSGNHPEGGWNDNYNTHADYTNASDYDSDDGYDEGDDHTEIVDFYGSSRAGSAAPYDSEDDFGYPDALDEKYLTEM